jgi:hypothetical protein
MAGTQLAVRVPRPPPARPLVRPALLAIAAVVVALAVGVLLAFDPAWGIALLLALLWVPVALLDLPLAVALWLPLVFLADLPGVSPAMRAASVVLVFAWLGTLRVGGGAAPPGGTDHDLRPPRRPAGVLTRLGGEPRRRPRAAARLDHVAAAVRRGGLGLREPAQPSARARRLRRGCGTVGAGRPRRQRTRPLRDDVHGGAGPAAGRDRRPQLPRGEHRARIGSPS